MDLLGGDWMRSYYKKKEWGLEKEIQWIFENTVNKGTEARKFWNASIDFLRGYFIQCNTDLKGNGKRKCRWFWKRF